MRSIVYAIDIPAPTSDVWDVLVATDLYGEWNPFMTQVEGVLEPGSRLRVTIQPGKRSMTFKPMVLAVHTGRLIRWQGKVGFRGIFDGEHELRVDPAGDRGSRFTQSEKFSGALIPLMGGTLTATASGFAAMNEALLVRVLAHRRLGQP
jgi:hypothetical protein